MGYHVSEKRVAGNVEGNTQALGGGRGGREEGGSTHDKDSSLWKEKWKGECEFLITTPFLWLLNGNSNKYSYTTN